MATTVLSLTLYANPSQANEQYSKEVYCLAQNIYFESRGESIRGQLAVAKVTINRTKDEDYPNTICKVVKQGCQFSWICDGKSDILPVKSVAGQQALKLATQVISNTELVDITDGALYFHAKYAKPSWTKKMEKTIEIGNHIFYRRS